MKLEIDLPDEIIAKIEDDIKGTSYTSAASFVEDLVKQKYPDLRDRDYTEEEEEIIRERLRKLGYIE